MKLNFFKKNNSLPSLKSLRPQIFNTNLFWLASLVLSLAIIVVTALVGFNLFYSQYSESYKNSKPAEDFSSLINVNRLNSAIESRNAFINEKISTPRDPSL